MLRLILAGVGAYLLGSVPTAYLLVRWTKRVDIRQIGSGNVGATNAARAAGLAIGVSVFVLDLLKGVVAVRGVAPWLMPAYGSAGRLVCGLLAVIGHTAPVWLSFRGGKGVATTIGVLLGTMPDVAVVALLIWVACAAIWRYVSVASLSAAVAIPLMQYLTHRSAAECWLGVGLALLIVLRHWGNITRVLKGAEPRIGMRERLPRRQGPVP